MLDVLKSRRSIRKYKDQPIGETQMQALYEAMQVTPSWKNKQCWDVVHVQNRETIAEIGSIVRNNPSENTYQNIHDIFVVCGDPTRSGIRDEKPYYMSDCALLISNLTLCAASLSLGSCWVGVFPEEEIKQLLHIPTHLRVVALVPVGHPDEQVEARPRKECTTFIHKNIYK